MDMDMKFSSVVIGICLLSIKGLMVRGGVHQSPASLEVPVGASVELSCRFDEPATLPRTAVFQWDLPDGQLYSVVPAGRVGGSAGQRVSLRADLRSRTSRLTVARVSPEDSGHYICIVQLLEPLPIVQMEGAGTHLRIVPDSTPVPGSVSQSPASLSVREGETVNLTCTLQTPATNVEGMKFIWSWGTSSTTCSAVTSDSNLWQCAPVPDPRVLVTTDLQTKSSEFRITRALLGHTGTFNCDVVITKPLAMVTLHGNGSVVLVEASPPAVSQFPALLPVAEGEDARLTCVLHQAAADVGNLSFTWVGGGDEVSCPVAASGRESNRCEGLDPRVSVEAHILNKSSILTIKEASVMDNGTYWCQVTLLDPPRNQTVGGDGSVLLVHGDVESPGTNESEGVLLLPVNTEPGSRRRVTEPWFFIPLMCVVGLTLTGGLGFSYWTTRRSGSGGEAEILWEPSGGTVHVLATSLPPDSRRSRATWQDPREPEGSVLVEDKSDGSRPCSVSGTDL